MEERVLTAFRRKHQIDVVYIDFAKAFDKVDHRILISKLRGYGVLGPLLDWFGDYLSNRRLAVKIGSTLSSEFLQVSGIPQGSHLGPPLFNLFINDLLDAVKVEALMFADDLKLFTEVSCDADSAQLQLALGEVASWCVSNNMQINVGKCAIITFHRSRSPALHHYSLDGSEIARASSIKDLGVLFTSDLHFGEHVNSICTTANRMLGFISRSTKGITNPHTLKVLYCSLVRQGLEYSSPVWSPYTAHLIGRLEAVQRRFLRLVGVRMGWRYHDVPTDDLADFLGLLPLYVRRQISDIVTLFKVINGYLSCPELLAEIDFRIPSGTRSTDLFKCRFRARQYDFCSPLSRFTRLGNAVNSDIDFFSDKIPVIRKKLQVAAASEH
jgi:ribonuclease P/MRP protein subunit RPP40